MFKSLTWQLMRNFQAPSNGLKNRITKENKEPWDKVQRAKISYRSDLGQGKRCWEWRAPRWRQTKAKFLDFTFLTWFQALKKKKIKTWNCHWTMEEKRTDNKGAQIEISLHLCDWKNLRLQSGVPDTSKSEQVHALLFQLPYSMTLWTSLWITTGKMMEKQKKW